MARQTWIRRAAVAVGVCGSLSLVIPAGPAAALPPAPSNIVIELDGSAATKTMALSWTPTTYSPFNSYEIFSGSGAGSIDWFDYLTTKSASSYSLAGWGVKTAPGAFALGSTYSVGMDIAEGPGVAGPKALADVKMVATPTVTVTGTTTSSLSIAWTAAAASDPFVSYDIFLAPTSYGGSLASCWSTWEGVRTATTKTLTAVPAACGGGSITANTSYKVGVRTIQRTGNPTVWTKIGEASARALPAQCTSTNEAYCTVFPNGFVKNLSWPAAQQGQAVTLNGVNTKYGPRYSGGQPGTGTWNTSDVQAVITQLKGPGGPTAMNAVRVNLDWGMFQYKTTGGSIVIDPDALLALDAVIDHAATNNVNVVLVPIHLRQPGSACLAGGLPRLLNATFNVPRWAWDQLDPTLSTAGCNNSYPAAFNDLIDDVVSLPAARAYFRTLASRYSDTSTTAKARLSRAVVAIDLVNEMPADGATVALRATKVINVYKAIVDDLRANTTATKKVLIVGPAHGDTSLKQSIADLQSLSTGRSNLVLSLHDYFGGAPGGAALSGGNLGATGYGLGYSSSGWKSTTYQQFTDTTAVTYTYANEASQHRQYVEQYAGWAAQAQLPVYVGEYGVYNPCSGNSAAGANSYATDTKNLYNTVTTPLPGGGTAAVPLSRTWWAHGFAGADAAMDLRRTSSGCASQAAGTYFAHAANL